MKHLWILIAALVMASCAGGRDYDVVIVGGGTSGTAAAIQAARSGAKVLLVEEHEWLGGMLTSAGVSATDGCYKLRGGISPTSPHVRRTSKYVSILLRQASSILMTAGK